MAIINKGKSFANGEQLTADKLNQVIDNATFTISAVDNTSTQLSSGAIIVKDGGVTTAKLNDGAVTTAKIADANVTFAKLTDVIDDDTMATATDTTLATSESIKAYVDTITIGVGQAWQSFGTPARTDGTSYQNTTGKPIMVAIRGRDDANPSAQVSSDGIAWITLGLFVDQSLGGAAFTNISFIVPNNHYYRTTASLADRFWSELR